MEVTDFPEGKLCSHANGFGVAGVFPADFVSCITSTCTLLHAKPRFMHWNVTGNADTRQTMFPRLCFHDQIFYVTVISHNNAQGVKAVYAEFSLVTFNTVIISTAIYAAPRLVSKKKLIHIVFWLTHKQVGFNKTKGYFYETNETENYSVNSLLK